ncbi:hypothetical protein GCM10017744_069140 [Streptomyces antimycoticus]
MVDTRAARVLEEGRRAMLSEKEFAWVREQAMEGAGGTPGRPGQEGPGAFGGYDHLLLGTSLPWLLPHFVHDVEAWNASVCGGRRGGRWARIGEDLRQRGDLEHWAAFPESFDALTDTIAAVGGAPGAPATISVLSGDVHHAYVAAPDWSRWSSRPPRSQVRQLTCSPVHNSIYASIRLGFRFGWSAAGRALGRLFRRHGRVPGSRLTWHKTGGPWFGNQLMTLTLQGRSAHLRLDQARSDASGGAARLVTALETDWAG